jgi:hypothetical protein
MTTAQIAEQLQRLVKNGVIRGRDTLDADDYMQLAILARDYVLFELKKGNDMAYMDLEVTNVEHILPIKNQKVEFPSGYNAQGISGAELLDSSEEPVGDIFPIPKGASPLIRNTVFSYYQIGQTGITFRNIPNTAKFLKIYNVCGASPDDEVSNAVAWLIFQQIYKLGTQSEQIQKDTSADGSGMSDAMREQIKQMINTPNSIIT